MKKIFIITATATIFAFFLIGTIVSTGFAIDKTTDANITNWVQDALQSDTRIDASEITVSAKKGIVTLSGVVANITAKQYASIEAKKIDGVSGVINNILPLPKWHSDENIRNTLQNSILNSSTINSKAINIISQDGKVTLTGKVHTSAEKKAVGLLAGRVRGVKEVKNSITVNLKRNSSDREIKNDAMAVLNQDVYFSGLPIAVSVKNGVVTLKGTVGSDYEKNRAGNDICLVSNVKELQNKLTVDMQDNHGVRTRQINVSDEDLKLSVREVLDQDRRINASRINIKVLSGHVTLDGSVDSHHGKRVVKLDVRDVVGVVGIENNLSIPVEKRVN